MDTVLNNFSTWAPSLALAGMLALFQGHNAPVPSRCLPQVRLVASCVLFTATYLLFRDKDSNFSPRKMNALLVFGFVLHYYFGPNNFMVSTDALMKKPQVPVASRAPVTNAFYRMPPSGDKRRARLRMPKTKSKSFMPEGWNAQVDGGSIYRGGNERKTSSKRLKYVPEMVAEWSPTNANFDNIAKDNELIHLKSPLPKWNRISSGTYPANTLAQLGRIPIKNQQPLDAVKSDVPEDQATEAEPEAKPKSKNKHVAVVEDLTRKSGPETFRMNPIECYHAKCAMTGHENDPKNKFKQQPTSFTIIPRSIPGITSDMESTLRTAAPPAPAAPVDDAPEPPKTSKPPTAVSHGKLREDDNGSPGLKEKMNKKSETLLSKSNRRLPAQQAPRALKTVAQYYQSESSQDSSDDEKPSEDTLPPEEGAEKARQRHYENSREHRRRLLARSYSASARDNSKMRDVSKYRHDVGPRIGRFHDGWNDRRYPQLRSVVENDPWADSFDNTTPRWLGKRTIRSNAFESFFNAATNWKHLLLLSMIVMSHVGFYMVVHNYDSRRIANVQTSSENNFKYLHRQQLNVPTFKSDAVDNGFINFPASIFQNDGGVWNSEKPQQTNNPHHTTNEELPAGEGSLYSLLSEPLVSGYLEVFLVFCLVKGTIDCVDKFYAS